MALYQTNVGDRILAADINQFYNILKGVAASGEAITLIYNAAGVIALTPSSDPAAGTELIQVKNAASTVQSALSSDGRFYSGDGLVGTPGVTFESDKDTGLYRIGANNLGVATAGAKILDMTTTGVGIGIAPVQANAALSIPSTVPFVAFDYTNGQAASRRWGIRVDQLAFGDFSIVTEASQASGTLATTRLAIDPSGIVNFVSGGVALGGGSAPTLGTIGGSGPATAGQNSWLKVAINGTASYLPVWR